MANPLSSTQHAGPPEELLRRIPWIHHVRRLNRGVFLIEKATVCAAMLIMSIIVFLDVYARFLRSQQNTFSRLESGRANWVDLWPVLALTLVGWFLFRAVFRTNPHLKGSPWLQRTFTALGLVVVVLLSIAMAQLPSATILGTLIILTGLVLTRIEFDRAVPLQTPTWHLRRITHLILIVGTTIAGLTLIQNAPTGWSWSQNFALFLLLWTAFIGASMATYERRHLTIDAMRKVVPGHLLPLFNGISHTLAAIVTFGILYLAVLYFQLRIGDSPIPGEIPTWIKVLAIPVSLAMVALRFLGHGLIGFLTMFLVPADKRAPAPVSLDFEPVAAGQQPDDGRNSQ